MDVTDLWTLVDFPLILLTQTDWDTITLKVQDMEAYILYPTSVSIYIFIFLLKRLTVLLHGR